MQREGRHKKEKPQHDPDLDEKKKNQSSEFFLVDFEEMFRLGCAEVPRELSPPQIEQGEYEADDKCGEEKVPKENDFLALHSAIIDFTDARSITNGTTDPA
jgi:hypothetical protein